VRNTINWLVERFQASIWPIPAMICLLMFALALAMIQLERSLGGPVSGFDSFVMTVSSARQLLGVITSAVLSVGGVAFSITMVALSLTSGQYGPRVLRQFLEGAGSKVSLGLYLGTSVYALVTIFSYTDADQPQITVAIALALVIVALGSFIQFIHRTATDLQADQIIQRIGSQLSQVLKEFCSEESLALRSSDTLPWRRRARGHRCLPVTAGCTGYLQRVDYAELAAWCERHDCAARVEVQPGDFLLEAGGICRIAGCDTAVLAAQLDEIRGCFLTGPIRTPMQDVVYPISQLNQVAARALSPGINDPVTAITCIDWFCAGLAHIIDRDLPGDVVRDGSGAERLLVRSYQLPEVLESVYGPLRRMAAGNIPVTTSLFESLQRLAALTQRKRRLDALRAQGDLVWDATAGQEMADLDRQALRQQYLRLCRATGGTLQHRP
jgi:uncharacterized membrane protein